MTEIVSTDAWREARLTLLEREKEFTRARDALSAARRQLPKVRIARDYRFASTRGEVGLAELFGDCGQLIVYHFMFGPDWDEGCPSCSFWADNYDGIVVHLNHRDINLVAVSSGSLQKIQAYRQRMGWSFEWVSSMGSDFNQDFAVTFSNQQIESGEPIYNFGTRSFGLTEAPGISVFNRDPDGQVFHTYSCYSRGLDMLNGAYHLMDLTPKGRDEGNLPYSMAWLRRRDCY